MKNNNTDKYVKSYKWLKLKKDPPKNAVLYVLDPETGDVELFITDKNGNPKPIKTESPVNIGDYVKTNSNNIINVEQNKIFVKKTVSGDEFINIQETNSNYILTLNEGTIEFKENKQNNLNPDGTGTKYPTVDAVNEKFEEVIELIDDVSGDKNFVYEQTTPSKVWEFSHPLNKKPSVQITDSAGTIVEGNIIINDDISIKIEFNISFWGYAILN